MFNKQSQHFHIDYLDETAGVGEVLVSDAVLGDLVWGGSREQLGDRSSAEDRVRDSVSAASAVSTRLSSQIWSVLCNNSDPWPSLTRRQWSHSTHHNSSLTSVTSDRGQWSELINTAPLTLTWHLPVSPPSSCIQRYKWRSSLSSPSSTTSYQGGEISWKN